MGTQNLKRKKQFKGEGMKIAIIGAGHVGLVTGACFAELGNEVICMDNNLDKIKLLTSGNVPIYEPGLEKLINKNRKKQKLFFTHSLQKAVKNSLVIFIAVGTPSRTNGEADLSYVENVARQIARYMDSYHLIVEKSTVPSGTGERVKRTLSLYIKKNIEFDVASNPEFLREGQAIKDFMEPDRVVIGVETERAKKLLLQLYQPLNTKIIVTDIKSAELIKHASNSYLAMKISFINAVAQICEKTGADIEKVAEGMGLDKRIGMSFLKAGVGYGGSCFPKDVNAFIRIAERLGYNFKLLEEVEKINQLQRKNFIKKIEDALWVIKNKKIAIWGISFKPNTDDIRESPAIDILASLKGEGAILRVYDPKAMGNLRKIFKNEIYYAKNPYDAIENCDCLLILTDWDEFKKANLKKVKELLRIPLIIDGRNIYNLNKLGALGFDYISIGRRKLLNDAYLKR
jgi:UDPglucose 6-dehydrogenase